ncbi:3-deoxy-7-phosphoheptulonate synthase [Anoxynatronum buryatiense]|uniref:3-deoxy-D-arabinoheptulosonate-7-phosphate synthase n=1 Tax=Anoxynatronum buryatiense TaxID=489973 RepID=A0AA45WYM9_9CLOT|nr:3-deoxy-7-phosphoheptulonate synthase [Anoxynatronum buryatiense]SMP68181.1 3-deoxy-D-arabinoheptulosonate-7-phosphate synthase [Anoxynatronum buryatiense]
MVIVMKPSAPTAIIEKIKQKMLSLGCEVHESKGTDRTLLGLVGDTRRINPSQIEANEHVERLIRVMHPFKLASRDFHPKDTVVELDGVTIGNGSLVMMAGPCAVESEDQLMDIALNVRQLGARMLRGGAFKPRTSPYSFQGMGEEGLKLLKKAKEVTGMPVVSEAMDQENFDMVAEYVDLIQIGARNMQNFALLKQAGKSGKPILLKRGMSATVEEFLMSAEYVLAQGNPNVVLCERGIRTFETYTRNTLDLSAVPVIKELSHLPVVVDPSHGTGKWTLVEPMSKAAVAVGADGLIVEVHNQPEEALSDGSQSLKYDNFQRLMDTVQKIYAVR